MATHRKISDIVPRRKTVGSSGGQALKEEVVMPPKPARRTVKRKEPAPPTSRPGQAEPVVVKKTQEPDFFAVAVSETRIDAGMPPPEREEHPRPTIRYRRSRHGIRIAGIAIVVLVAVGVGAWFLLPKAVVALTMKKHPVAFSETVVVAAEPSAIGASSAIVIPGEALTARANLSLPFTAQATETVSARATGILTVYNSYSSAPQALVRNTRFESPDKKIFRLEQAVTVPGAKVEGGKVTPSSIEVSVVAEETGETYNLPASSGWRIPGFAGSPRYDGFYAEAKQGMKGGFVGERAKPSAAELANARTELTASLTDALESQFLIILSDRFTALPGSRRVTLVAEEITRDVEDVHTFHLFGEAVMEQIVFEEPTLKNALVAEAGRTLPKELAVRDFTYALGTSTADFAKDTLTFKAEGEGIFTEPFDVDAFRAAMAGKGEAELKAAVFAIPGVEEATVSLSPFFVRSVPQNPEKIEVTVE